MKLPSFNRSATPCAFDQPRLSSLRRNATMANAPKILGLPDTGPFQRVPSYLTDLKIFLFAVIPIIIIYLLHLRATRLRVVPNGVPWVGLRNEWFSKTRANIRELFNSKLNIEEGYQKVNRLSCPFSRVAKSHSTDINRPVWQVWKTVHHAKLDFQSRGYAATFLYAMAASTARFGTLHSQGAPC